MRLKIPSNSISAEFVTEKLVTSDEEIWHKFVALQGAAKIGINIYLLFKVNAIQGTNR